MNFSDFKEGSLSKTTPIQQKIRDKIKYIRTKIINNLDNKYQK